MKHEGKTAVITGGASGIGLKSAIRFLQEGASVLVADLTIGDPAESPLAVAAQQQGVADRLLQTQADVSKEADIEHIIKLAQKEFGSVDIMFNNAGTIGANELINNCTEEDFDVTFGVNVKSVVFGIKHAARIMREQPEGGSIISTASIAGITGDSGPTLYSASKAAVISLTKSCAVQLAKHHIRVNAICPGGIATPMVSLGDDEKTETFLKSLQPWPEYGRPEDIAAVASFLASADASFITGEAITVDGGVVPRGPGTWSPLANPSD